MSDEFKIKEFHQTKIIFEEGTAGDTAYIVKQGKVRITKKIVGGKLMLTELGPGSIFGELALLTRKQERTATAEAVEYTEVIEIDKTKFDQLMEQSPAIIANILRAFGKRIIELSSKLADQKKAIRP